MENVIKHARKEKGFSQEQLAKACRVSRQTINAIENNKYDPSLSLAFQLAYCLGVTVDQLFLFESEGDVRNEKN
ncbi:helix-turn-helix transcriptional regulator [Bacillus inaquosorum]|uniref:helix-turn-helix transcriptional regulator n=1 Tax=Bacillus inaquosorum TaxID=483913 RepID=UPI003D254D9E